MKKRVFGRKLGRTKNQRKALFRGLVSSLIIEGEIKTTLPKAKAIKPLAEKLITKAIDGSLSGRRAIFSFLGKRALVNRLTDEIAPVFKDRKGGYLRIIHSGIRKGDAAPMAKVMFVEKIEPMVKEKPKKVKPEEKVEKKEKKK